MSLQEIPPAIAPIKPPSPPKLTVLIFALALMLSLGAILSFNVQLLRQVALNVGDRVTETIVADRSLTYESEVLTAEEKRQVSAGIFLYTPIDRSIGRTQTNRARSIFAFVDVVRSDALASLETKINYIQSIHELAISPEVAEQLVTISASEYNSVKNETILILAETMQQEVHPDQLHEVKEAALRNINLELNFVQEAIVSSLVPQFVIPNIFFDEEATAEARAQAAAAVKPVQIVITSGQPVIRVGEVVEQRHLETLGKLGLLQQTITWYSISSSFLLAILLSTIMALYWMRFHPRRHRIYRDSLILYIFIVIFTLAGKFAIVNSEQYAYLLPVAGVSMLMTAIMDVRLGIIVSWVLSVLLGYMANQSLEVTLYLGVGSMIPVLPLRDTQRFSSYLRSGLMSAVSNVVIVLLFNLTPITLLTDLTLLISLAIVNGLILAPLFTMAGFFFVGLFGITTVIQLQDLARLDHPLLKELLRRAPGTYHHSIMVANLAEQAAERTATNSTLVRVGAFYHDIGKMNRPAYFTENQERGENPHNELDPYESAKIIVAHVSDGLVLARKYRLPSRIQDFIAEHHGNNLLKLFYEKAKQAAGGDPAAIDELLFRYPGPRPRSRETGLVLLADTVEAASSALRPSTIAEIEKLVNSLVDNHLKAGQLDDSGLTLGDLQQIRSSFIETLQGRFHVRVQYPGNEQMMEQPPSLPAGAPYHTPPTSPEEHDTVAHRRTN